MLLAVLGLAALAVRRRVIQRRGGTFDCSLRNRSRSAPKGWMLGVGRYATDTVEWYRVFSYSPRPRQVVQRRDLVVLSRRAPDAAEALALLPGAVIVECSSGGEVLELGMSPDALTGFLAWLEAAPPGQHPVVA
nr:DUF2550 domain-containing protein [Motilibacter aurantiacus]